MSRLTSLYDSIEHSSHMVDNFDSGINPTCFYFLPFLSHQSINCSDALFIKRERVKISLVKKEIKLEDIFQESPDCKAPTTSSSSSLLASSSSTSLTFFFLLREADHPFLHLPLFDPAMRQPFVTQKEPSHL